MGLKIKRQLCVGCRACEIVCAARHYDEFNPKRARIRVPFTHPLPSPPKFCFQCKKPKCVEACSKGALVRDEVKDIIVYNKEKCYMCFKCVEACPFDGIFYDELNKEILKCDLCGGDPQCVKFCQKKALYN
ncbi:MAG TPA: 4Fe-4S dicluster domain-containing protein [Thermoanaerobacterales bacterium]|nr:4Fe-4S dicluster domain-containing protein [Thermoanaerobacterales bacterium]